MGLAPAVTDLITTYDGGKLMSGYSKFDGMTVFGWAIKVFGEIGTTTGCAIGDKPTGYATFLTYPANTTGTGSTCSTKL